MIDRHLLQLTIALLTVSLVFTYSLSTYVTMLFGLDEFSFFIKQGIAVFLGIIIIFTLARLDPDLWFNRVGAFMFLFFLAAMIAMQFMPESIVREVGGAKRWINLGVVSISPVEFFKIGFVWFLAWSFSRKFAPHDGKKPYKEELLEVLPYMGVFAVVVVLIAIFQNDFGQVVVLSVTLATMLLFAGKSLRLFSSIFAVALAAFTFFILISDHRIERIRSWWSMIQDFVFQILPAGLEKYLRVKSGEEPYQIGHSLNSINNGDLFGTGLGNGQFKLGYLSEVHTDFVLAGITEELGFFGVSVLTMLFVVLIFRIFKIAGRSLDSRYYLFGVGTAMVIGLSFLINAYGISGIAPIKGIAVPFLSYGGSHIIASSIAIGMVLMISKKVVL